VIVIDLPLIIKVIELFIKFEKIDKLPIFRIIKLTILPCVSYLVNCDADRKPVLVIAYTVTKAPETFSAPRSQNVTDQTLPNREYVSLCGLMMYLFAARGFP
jgi:hypothetical protein